MGNKTKPKKSLGQNFLINPDIPREIALSGPLSEEFGVIEIGPGLGALTKELCRVAKKVVAIELDGDVIPKLLNDTKHFDNLVVINADVLETDLNEVIAKEFSGLRVAIFGNLPYYITTPIIMGILEKNINAEYVVAMVQKEAAERLAAAETTRDVGAVTLAVRYYSEPEILFDVPPDCFYPAPKVMSSVVRFNIRSEPPVFPKNQKNMFKVIKAAFAQRRKTAINSITSGTAKPKTQVEDVFKQLSLDPNIRAEKLTLINFSDISDIIFE